MLFANYEPVNYGEMMVSPYSGKWLETMKSEIGSMYENEVWTWIDLPNSRRPLRIKGSLRRNQMLMVMLPSIKHNSKRFSTDSRS
jgi:hypothetical protein